MTLEPRELLWNIFYYFTSISVITTGIVFLAKISIKYFVDKGIERYKTSLNKEVEIFKSELKIKETEYNIKFSKLHEERAQSIKTLYGLSLTLQNSLFSLTQPSQGIEWYKDEDLSNNLFRDLKILQRFFISNKILINNELCEKIQKFIDHCYEIDQNMQEAKMLGDSSEIALRHASIKIWRNQFHIYLNDIKNINEDLITEFRNILGVH